MISLIPEIFLSATVLLQLIFNAQCVNSIFQNYPILNKEVSSQTFFILICLLLLVYNLQVETHSFANFFLHTTGCKVIKLLIIVFSIIVTIFIRPAFIFQKLNFFEFFTLFLFAVLSFLLLTAAHNLMTIYLIIELQALCFYILASFLRNSAFSTEAGLKYFIFNSFISGFFLLGVFFVYSSLGTLNLAELFNILVFDLTNFNVTFQFIVFLGSFFILATFLFKLACAPLHFWAPDVYEGSPLSSTLIFSILPKMSLVFILSKLIFSFGSLLLTLQPILLFSGVLSCLIGTIYSLSQKRIKRLIIYSSIAQVGFIVSGLALNSIAGVTAVFFFLIIYLITSLLIWGHVVCFYYFNFKINSFNNLESDVFNLSHLVGFFKKNVVWTYSLILIFFSIAGIPPFTGFLAKVLIFFELVVEQKIVCAVSLIIISSISVFYYIRIIKIFFFEPQNFIKNNNETFQIIFLDSNLKFIYFIFVLLLFSLIIILIYPTKLYLLCQYLVLKSMF